MTERKYIANFAELIEQDYFKLPESGKYPKGTKFTHLQLGMYYPLDQREKVRLRHEGLPITTILTESYNPEKPEDSYVNRVAIREEKDAIWQRLVAGPGSNEDFWADKREVYGPVKHLEKIRSTYIDEHRLALYGMRSAFEEQYDEYINGLEDGLPRQSYWVIDTPADEVTGRAAERIYVAMNYQRSGGGVITFAGGYEYRGLEPDHPVAQWCDYWMGVLADHRSQPLFPENALS